VIPNGSTAERFELSGVNLHFLQPEA